MLVLKNFIFLYVIYPNKLLIILEMEKMGVKISYIHEDKPLGTAGALAPP